MCQDDAIVTFDHLLVHTNMLQHLFQTIPYCVLRRSCIDQCRFKLVKFRHKKRTAAIENEDILLNFFDTVMRFVYVYQNLRKRNTNSNKN